MVFVVRRLQELGRQRKNDVRFLHEGGVYDFAGPRDPAAFFLPPKFEAKLGAPWWCDGV